MSTHNDIMGTRLVQSTESGSVRKGETTTHISLPEKVAGDEGHEARVHESDEGGARGPAEVAPAVLVQFCRGLSAEVLLSSAGR